VAGLEDLATDERVFLIEAVMNAAVQRCEFLQCSHPPETERCPLSSSKALLEAFGTDVWPMAGFAQIDGAQGLERYVV
jgi:hypothetical protein